MRAIESCYCLESCRSEISIINCHVNGTTFQSGLRFQTDLSSLHISCKCQGRSKGTSSVALEVLIINCQIYFINSLIFNRLTLKIKLFIFKLFDICLFSENHVFQKQKRTTV